MSNDERKILKLQLMATVIAGLYARGVWRANQTSTQWAGDIVEDMMVVAGVDIKTVVTR